MATALTTRFRRATVDGRLTVEDTKEHRFVEHAARWDDAKADLVAETLNADPGHVVIFDWEDA